MSFIDNIGRAATGLIDSLDPFHQPHGAHGTQGQRGHGYASGRNPPPPNGMMLGFQHDGSGEYWLAVANTQWGRIPGKAKAGTCWFSYWGNEHSTNDFDYVTHPTSMTTTRDARGPPRSARPVGYQNDGRGDQYAIVANTRWGKICGKGCGNTAWYTFNGKEYETKDFEWVVCSKLNGANHNNLMDISYVQQPFTPPNGLRFGRQNDGGGEHCVAVAETPQGKIPGKAKDGTCWYGYNGKEMTTTNFHYVIQTSPHLLVRNTNTGPPPGAVQTGHQTDGRGIQYSVIANTQFGRIPGKATKDVCWYPMNGQEHETRDFEWVVFSR